MVTHVVASRCAWANLTGVSDFGHRTLAPRRISERCIVGRYDDFADGPQSDARKFQMRPREGNADDGDCEDNREQEVNEREPPTGQDQPHHISYGPQHAGPDITATEVLITRHRLEPERQQGVDADIEGGLRPWDADDGDSHDDGGDTPSDGRPQASEHHPEHVEQQGYGRHWGCSWL